MIPYVKGKVTLQAHVDIPEGVIEEEYARGGFFGAYAHLYRKTPPVEWEHIEGPLKPRAYDLRSTPTTSDFLAAREALLYNEDCRICFFSIQEMPYFFRNADADEIYFVHKGSGSIDTDFGPLNYTSGDYLLIPRGTVYRWFPKGVSQFLLIESFSEVKFPEKGMIGQHALFDPAVIKVPTPEDQKHPKGDYLLKIQRCNEITTVHYSFYPLNTVGWKGTLSVRQINVKDIRPISCDRYHLPPSAHTTFVARNFVICSFLPRPLENGDPKAMKVPFYHSNIDFDEVLFYHDGEFFSRTGVAPGMVTFHPQGIHHGPQSGAVERTKNATYTQEVAVMIDTQRPLKAASRANQFEVNNYWESWKRK